VHTRIANHFHLMGNHDHRQVHPLLQITEQGQYRAGGLWIERTGRFVAEQDIGMVRQGTCYRHALLLTSGKGAYRRVSASGKSYQIQQFLNTCLYPVLGDSGYFQRVGNVFSCIA